LGFSFKKSETLEENVRRVILRQGKKARNHLEKEGGDLHHGVHQARKRFKQIRAILRLVRPALGNTYKFENVAFRDMGRRLSDLRDAEARLECFDALMDAYGDEFDDGAFEDVRAALEEDRQAATREHVEEANAMADVARDLRKGLGRCQKLQVQGDAAEILRGGLEKTYGRGYRAMHEAYEQPTDEVFHEWRKRTKYLWYHVRLLRKTWKKPMKALRKEFHKLADLLGDDHDLAVMDAYLHANAGRLDKDVMQDMVRLMRRRRSELKTSARILGHKLYAETPEAFSARLAAYWSAWRE
jgi:CHAD domain-containing protein